MNSAPLPKPANSAKSQSPLRAGQIPTLHYLLDFETVESFADDMDTALEVLEAKYSTYVTAVSTKGSSRG